MTDKPLHEKLISEIMETSLDHDREEIGLDELKEWIIAIMNNCGRCKHNNYRCHACHRLYQMFELKPSEAKEMLDQLPDEQQLVTGRLRLGREAEHDAIRIEIPIHKIKER